MIKIKVLDKAFEIKSRFLGDDYPNWDKQNLHNKFSIKVKNLLNEKEISFIFWGSVEEWLKGKTKLNDFDLIYAFKCFLEDSLTYMENNNIDDFAKEYGFESVSETIKAFNGCKKAFEKCLKLELSESDIEDIFSELEKENESKLREIII
jgi:predicted nucleotidyltransferase